MAGKEEEEEASEVIDTRATTAACIEDAAIGEQALVPSANSDNNTNEGTQGPTSGEFETPAVRPKRSQPDSAVLPTVREQWGQPQALTEDSPQMMDKEYDLDDLEAQGRPVCSPEAKQVLRELRFPQFSEKESRRARSSKEKPLTKRERLRCNG